MWYYATIMPLFVLLFALSFFLFSRQFNQFYNWEWFEGSLSWETAEWLDILYSNILYKNTNYTGLKDTIIENDPDMVFMVEFADDHNENLKSILEKYYPYSARTNWSDRYFGSVVFSKYPIENLTHEVDQGKWRYTYFHTNYNNQNYYVYLIHVSSPVTYHYFQMRNDQFDILAADFAEHEQNRTDNDKVLMIWDFNVSPWSSDYEKLETNLTWLNNLTKNFTILFTWGIRYLPLFRSHIDHIFVSDNIEVTNIEKINTPGSDHDWFLLKWLR